MIIPSIWENKTCPKPPTRWEKYEKVWFKVLLTDLAVCFKFEGNKIQAGIMWLQEELYQSSKGAPAEHVDSLAFSVGGSIPHLGMACNGTSCASY